VHVFLSANVTNKPQLPQEADGLPNHSLILLLSDIGGYLAIHLTGTKRHGDSLSHVFLDRLWDVGIPVGRADPNVG
jgi:hypothetical protein